MENVYSLLAMRKEGACKHRDGPLRSVRIPDDAAPGLLEVVIEGRRGRRPHRWDATIIAENCAEEYSFEVHASPGITDFGLRNLRGKKYQTYAGFLGQFEHYYFPKLVRSVTSAIETAFFRGLPRLQEPSRVKYLRVDLLPWQPRGVWDFGREGDSFPTHLTARTALKKEQVWGDEAFAHYIQRLIPGLPSLSKPSTTLRYQSK